jgi:hypothetical protein
MKGRCFCCAAGAHECDFFALRDLLTAVHLKSI